MHFEALQQLCHDRGQQLRHEAETERLALQTRGQRQRRRRRLALHATFGLLLRGRRHARN